MAHKKAMKLGEMVGLSLAAQSTFATAVSEVLRTVVQQGTPVSLTLGISCSNEPHQCLMAKVRNCRAKIIRHLNETFKSVSQLVDDFNVSESEISLGVRFPFNQRVSNARMEEWKNQFGAESAESPYDEIIRKNHQLQELTNQLRVQEQQYQMLVSSLPLMIFTASSEGLLLYANDWLTQYTGQSLEALNQTRWAPVFHPDDAASYWEHWQTNVPTEKPFRHQLRIRNAETGQYVWHLITATALRDEKNKILCWSGFFVNIQAQKTAEQTLQAQQELTEAKQQLEQYQHELKMNIGELHRSNQELSEFAYMASHDLQEPLRKIQSISILLQEQFAAEMPPKAYDMVQRMQTAAERMHVLIRDLLSYSRLNTQHSFRPVDLNKLVGEVLEDMDTTREKGGAQIQIQLLPTLNGNPLQLRQLFQNLLSNALKFIHPGQTPHVQIRSQIVNIFDIPVPVRNRAPSYLAISVEDNGIGFDERYHDRIFQLFQRLHSRDQYAGTGIGLTICKKVAEMHGGAIAARSLPGQGATFTVYLPMNVVKEKAR
ncbi:sensor histidine kinase [Larkinella harenae]